MARDRAQPDAGWSIAAAFLAWLAPGAGHILLGERHRGIVLMTTIGGLWIGGLLIGGVGVIDRQAHPFWYLGQALTAPSIAVTYLNQEAKEAQARRQADRREDLFTPSLGRVNEQGVLYTALAGLLNLLAILDVLYRLPGEPPIPQGEP